MAVKDPKWNENRLDWILFQDTSILQIRYPQNVVLQDDYLHAMQGLNFQKYDQSNKEEVLTFEANGSYIEFRDPYAEVLIEYGDTYSDAREGKLSWQSRRVGNNDYKAEDYDLVVKGAPLIMRFKGYRFALPEGTVVGNLGSEVFTSHEKFIEYIASLYNLGEGYREEVTTFLSLAKGYNIKQALGENIGMSLSYKPRFSSTDAATTMLIDNLHLRLVEKSFNNTNKEVIIYNGGFYNSHTPSAMTTIRLPQFYNSEHPEASIRLICLEWTIDFMSVVRGSESRLRLGELKEGEVLVEEVYKSPDLRYDTITKNPDLSLYENTILFIEEDQEGWLEKLKRSNPNQLSIKSRNGKGMPIRYNYSSQTTLYSIFSYIVSSSSFKMNLLIMEKRDRPSLFINGIMNWSNKLALYHVEGRVFSRAGGTGDDTPFWKGHLSYDRFHAQNAAHPSPYQYFGSDRYNK